MRRQHREQPTGPIAVTLLHRPIDFLWMALAICGSCAIAVATLGLVPRL
jgi:hypothetical protein